MYIVALLCFLVSFAVPSIGNTGEEPVLHVSGTDATCGGRSPCFRTIQAAVDAARPGSIVRIQAGTYNERVVVADKNRSRHATEQQRIIIEAEPESAAGSVILQGRERRGNERCEEGRDWRYGFKFRNSRFVTLRGLTLRDISGPAVWLASDGREQDGNFAIHIELNRIFSSVEEGCGDGILVGAGNSQTLIVNNLIYNNGGSGISFAEDSGGPHYVINDTIYNNRGNGIEIAKNQSVTIVNNIINNNGTDRRSGRGRYGIWRENGGSSQPRAVKLLNNLICGNGAGEIRGEILDARDSGNFTPNGDDGPGVRPLPGCELAENLFADINGVDGIADTGDEDFSLKGDSLAIDVGIDPRTLGFKPGYSPIFEADFLSEAVRPADGNGDRVAIFDAGAMERLNGRPLALAGPDQIVVAGQQVQLNGSNSSDPEGAALAFVWSILEQPSGSSAVLSGHTSSTPAFIPGLPGLYRIQLVVDDGQFASDPALVIVTVLQTNRPPILSPIGSHVVTAGNTLDLTIQATDPDNDPLTFAVSPQPLPANASFNAASRKFVFTPTAAQAGLHNFTFTVEDGRGGTASETVAVTVAAGLSVQITSPVNGATLPAGPVIVRGRVSGTGEIGVSVNGFPAAVNGDEFLTIIDVVPETTSITVAAVNTAGLAASHSVSIAVSNVASLAFLDATPASGSAPLTVVFSFHSETPVVQTVFDANGDSIADFSGERLEQVTYKYTAPGTYFAVVNAVDSQGNAVTASRVVRVFDAVELDRLLQPKWLSIKDSLRRGDISSALEQITTRARPRYEEAFRIIEAQLSSIDEILTSINLVRVGNGYALYESVRMDDDLPMSFDVRFAIDADGIWRLEAF